MDILPKELIIIILTYCDYKIIEMDLFDTIEAEKLFQCKYEDLYVSIMRVRKEYRDECIDWKGLYLNMRYIDYEKLRNYINKKEEGKEFIISKNLQFITPETIDIIYSCLLLDIKLNPEYFGTISTFVIKNLMDKHLPSNNSSVFLYLICKDIDEMGIILDTNLRTQKDFNIVFMGATLLLYSWKLLTENNLPTIKEECKVIFKRFFSTYHEDYISMLELPNIIDWDYIGSIVTYVREDKDNISHHY